MRITLAAIGLFATLAITPHASAQPAKVQELAPAIQLAQVFQDRAYQADAPPPRRRPRVRIYQNDERGVYPSYNPGPNAVRDCSATYVQEFRPSGTVITPRLNCYWRRG